MAFILRGIMMNSRAFEIYENVINALQDADEIEGVEGNDYLKLMTAIAEDCMRRFDNCTDQWASDQEANTNSH
jgi:hypothetical protein